MCVRVWKQQNIEKGDGRIHWRLFFCASIFGNIFQWNHAQNTKQKCENVHGKEEKKYMKSIKSYCTQAIKKTSFALEMSSKQRKMDFTDTNERGKNGRFFYIKCWALADPIPSILVKKNVCVCETEFIAIGFCVGAPISIAQVNENRRIFFNDFNIWSDVCNNNNDNHFFLIKWKYNFKPIPFLQLKHITRHTLTAAEFLFFLLNFFHFRPLSVFRRIFSIYHNSRIVPPVHFSMMNEYVR